MSEQLLPQQPCAQCGRTMPESPVVIAEIRDDGTADIFRDGNQLTTFHPESAVRIQDRVCEWATGKFNVHFHYPKGGAS